MKAELVYGKLVQIDDNTLTVKDKEGTILEYPIATELNEDWVANNLGTWLEVVIINGEVRGFRSE